MSRINNFLKELNLLEAKYNIKIEEWIYEEYDEDYDGNMFSLGAESGLRLVDKIDKDTVNIKRNEDNILEQE
mgnify:CR=1 FL=1